MPYKYRKVGNKYCVYKKDSGKKVGCTDGTKKALNKYLTALRMNESRVNELFDSSELKDINEIPYLTGEISSKELLKKDFVHDTNKPYKPIEKLGYLIYKEIYWVKYLLPYELIGSNTQYIQSEEKDDMGIYLLRIEMKPIGNSIKVSITDFVESSDGRVKDGKVSETIGSDISELLKFVKGQGFKHFKRWSENVSKARKLNKIPNWDVDDMRVKADLNSLKYIKKFSDI